MASKRVCAIADLHSGHRVGLTPPDYQENYTVAPTLDKQNKWADIQRALWKHYTEAIDRIKPIDILLVVGDMTDGKGQRSGGTEQIKLARDSQAEMAATGIRYTEAKIIRCVYGTPYHVGTDEDWENAVVAELQKDNALDIKIGSHEWIDVNGVIFDMKHFTSQSSIPHGKGTLLSKEWLWNVLWAERQLQPRADIYLRAHVHNYFYCGDTSYRALTLPALQGMGSKFGSRICKNIVDFGIVSYDITSSGKWIEIPDIITVKEQATTAEKL